MKERERERESVCVCVCVKEREKVCVCVCVCESDMCACPLSSFPPRPSSFGTLLHVHITSIPTPPKKSQSLFSSLYLIMRTRGTSNGQFIQQRVLIHIFIQELTSTFPCTYSCTCSKPPLILGHLVEGERENSARARGWGGDKSKRGFKSSNTTSKFHRSDAWGQDVLSSRIKRAGKPRQQDR